VRRFALPFFEGLPLHPADVWLRGFIRRQETDPDTVSCKPGTNTYYDSEQEAHYEKWKDTDCDTGGLLHFYWDHLTKNLGNDLPHSPFLLSCGSNTPFQET